MNNLISISNSTLSMTSREIAELTGKSHSHVLRDIDNLINTLEPGLVSGYKSTTYVSADGRTLRQFEMDRDSTICLISGYDPNSRMRIIKRWQELESAVINTNVSVSSFTPHEIAVKQFRGELEVWTLLECPVHIAQQEIVKIVRKDTGIDFSDALKHAAAQQNILSGDVMLEPTEIGTHFNLGSGKVVNKLLNGLGLQTFVNRQWEPTDIGKPHCQKHAWTVKNKSGYNLKWNLKFLENYFKPDPNQP